MDKAQLIKNLEELEVEDTAEPATLYNVLCGYFAGEDDFNDSPSVVQKADFAIAHFADCIESIIVRERVSPGDTVTWPKPVESTCTIHEGTDTCENTDHNGMRDPWERLEYAYKLVINNQVRAMRPDGTVDHDMVVLDALTMRHLIEVLGVCPKDKE